MPRECCNRSLANTSNSNCKLHENILQPPEWSACELHYREHREFLRSFQCYFSFFVFPIFPAFLHRKACTVRPSARAFSLSMFVGLPRRGKPSPFFFSFSLAASSIRVLRDKSHLSISLSSHIYLGRVRTGAGKPSSAATCRSRARCFLKLPSPRPPSLAASSTKLINRSNFFTSTGDISRGRSGPSFPDDKITCEKKARKNWNYTDRHEAARPLKPTHSADRLLFHD